MKTKDKILAAAKLHFSEFGLQHASVRAITKLADVNSSLIRYHFGSKAELYKEVVQDCAKSMIEERLATLDLLQKTHNGRPIPVEQLLDAYARPVLRNPKDSERDAAIYIRMFGRMYTEPSDELRDITQNQFTEIQMTFVDEICRSVPQMPRDEVVFRFGLMLGSLVLLGSSTGVIETLSDRRVDPKENEEWAIREFVRSYSLFFRVESVDVNGLEAMSEVAAER